MRLRARPAVTGAVPRPKPDTGYPVRSRRLPLGSLAA